MQCLVVGFEMGLCVWCDFGQLYVNAKYYVPVLLKNLRGMSCSGTYWLLGWFQWRLLDDVLLINAPCIQEFSGVLRFWA